MKSDYTVRSGCLTGFPIISIVAPAEPSDTAPAPSNSAILSSVSPSRAITPSFIGDPNETDANRRTETRLEKWISAVSAIAMTIVLLAAATAPDIF